MGVADAEQLAMCENATPDATKYSQLLPSLHLTKQGSLRNFRLHLPNLTHQIA